MLTVRYIERLWGARKYDRLLQELMSPRVEASAAGELALTPTACAAALALVRLDELHQPHAAICSRLIRTLVSLQESDGGWGDVATTALCLRALSLQNGHGQAIDRGMDYLAMLQQPTGIWPKIPIRRMPEDALVSAFAMFQLADNDQFRTAVDFDAACVWFDAHRWTLEPAAQLLWDHARLRVPATTTRAVAEPSWS
ncbi:MAG TPA: hypothetical protein VHX86_11740 [Tepidisphaeraceae bacterium]|jgi:hypothetical protein|nr:hypothetical protein [Tepidisphaeraceae bacterium]